MKNKILAKYPKSKFTTTKSKNIYIADFTQRTKTLTQKRGVEFLDQQPADPVDPTKEMHYLFVDNPKAVSIACNVFDDNQFIDNTNHKLKHGECCFFPTKNDGRSWFSIVEIKDLEKPSNINYYYAEIREKRDRMLDIFRNDVGITQTIYFILSFPMQQGKKNVPFNDTIFSDYVELKRKKFFPIVTNHLVITDTHDIEYYE